MPAISKIRLCNVLYENGQKRYNDQLFHIDGQNTAILLENGGGKTVFIQTLLQCIIPHISMADRKIKDTLYLENGPAHIAIEWILQDRPRRYGLTCVSLYLENNTLNSLKYAYEYSGEEREDIEALPFKIEVTKNAFRPATKGEIGDYYQKMTKTNTYARVFSTIQEYGSHLENAFKIIPSEWRKVATINSGEGNVDEFFNRCRTTAQLLDYLLLPVVTEAIEGDYHRRFAETFETQREHFKKNRVLNEKIEQASMVKKEVDAYIETYKKYAKVIEENNQLLKKARTYYEYVQEQIQGIAIEKEKVDAEKIAIAAMQKEQLAREISYKLLMLDAKIEEYDRVILQTEKELKQLTQRRDLVAKRRQNIQITKVNHLVRETETEINRLEIEISIEEKKMPAEDLLLQLEENSCQIKGYYLYEIEKLETELKKNQQETVTIRHQSEQLKTTMEQMESKKVGLSEQVYKLQALRNFLQEKMDEIYDDLFAEEIGLQIDMEAKGWLKEKTELNLRLKQYDLEEYRIFQESEEHKHEEADLQVEKERIKEVLNKAQEEVESIQEKANSLYEEFRQNGIEFQMQDVIHTKEEIMKNLIHEHFQNLLEKKRTLRYPISVLCEESVFDKVLRKVDELQANTQSLILVHKNQGSDFNTGRFEDLERMESISDFENRSKETEKEISLCNEKMYALNRLHEHYRAFFEAYPYEGYRDRLQQIRQYENEAEKVKVSLEKLNQRHQELEAQRVEVEIAKTEICERLKELEQKLQFALEHEAYLTNYEEHRNREEGYFIELQELESEIRRVKKTWDQCQEELLSLQTYQKEYQFEMKKIQESGLYEEVKGYDAFCTNEDLSGLKGKRDSLKARLQGLSVTRNQLLQRKDELQKLSDHYLDQKKRLNKEAQYDIEEIELYYEHEEDDLFDQMMLLKQEIRVLDQVVKTNEKERYGLSAKKDMLTKELQDKGLTSISFEGGAEQAKHVIKIYEATVQNREKSVREKENELQRTLRFYEKVQTDLLIKEATYPFLSMQGIPLSQKERKELVQQLQEEVNDLFKQLAKRRSLQTEEAMKVQRLKQQIIDYCDHSIKDHRLKEGVVNGLLQKDSVEDLLNYQEKLAEIIEKTIQLANDDKRESDIELNNFLKHLFIYVQTMLNELGELQKKTSIELHGELTQIFLFDIPAYEEEEAKEALRKYIEKIVDRYDEALNEEEQRMTMEEKLHINNLIPVVLGNREIKVRCRKVSNDLSLNLTPLSWEYSNKWSGGEKWSKNMTLFLGILNYLAEKKQYLSGNQKRNRTVILDNPFGKASSKHVLDPVFFIAEKLGFQIIALTAHAEGQFISDYFPVVYSLRLRSASKDTKLMTAGRTINHVYLKENSPQSIERFKEVLQLDLFSTSS